MKANRAFRDDAGVSPVIGGIILIAITVVLSATVFLTVQQLNKDNAPAPKITTLKDEVQNTVSIRTIDWDGDPLYWSNTTGSSDYLVVVGCDSVNGNNLDGTVLVQVSDVLQCSPGQVTISHPLSEHLVFTTTFT